MLDLMYREILPVAMSMLPAKMNTPEARQMLLTIGLQESGFRERHQTKGPARGFWQFELPGVHEVMRHPASAKYVGNVFSSLKYPMLAPPQVLSAIEHNDMLAACFARLALWRHPDALTDNGPDMWFVYKEVWGPGKPHPGTWLTHWNTAGEELAKIMREGE